jgi:DNA replication and repair protein RecF
MSLQKLDIYNVRNILQASIQLSPALNFIYGKNASGKSSFLEALYILGRAKSFRCSSIKQVINFDADEIIVSGQCLQKNQFTAQLGIRLSRNEISIHINQELNSLRSELAYIFPLQIITPKSYKLLDEGPQIRREFIDWGVFNFTNDFLLSWRKYKKALMQRNSLLKQKYISQINSWDQELVQYGTIVKEHRQNYLDLLQPVFTDIASHFLNIGQLKLNYLCGWDANRQFHDVLKQDLEKDTRYGFTHSGPHRADFQLLINNRLAKDFVSRGQLKLLVLALKLSQVKILEQYHNKSGCVLIDDITSELDLNNRTKLINFLFDLKVQVFMTATEMFDFGDLNKFSDFKVFHVEQGIIHML